MYSYLEAQECDVRSYHHRKGEVLRMQFNFPCFGPIVVESPYCMFTVPVPSGRCTPYVIIGEPVIIMVTL